MSAFAQPITVDEFEKNIKELTDDTIVNVRESIETSLTKLTETNEYLQKELSSTSDEEDRKLYQETITENEDVIARQKQKLEVLMMEFRLRNLLPEKEQGGVYL